MEIAEAMGYAAQAWCDEPNQNTILDEKLAKSFAHILREKVQQAVRSERIKAARKAMAESLSMDPSLKWAYVSNIAMFLNDHYGITDYDKRNEAAEGILELLFKDCPDDEDAVKRVFASVLGD